VADAAGGAAAVAEVVEPAALASADPMVAFVRMKF
jgi:hypothetical protein